jgi:hypothetical protein
LLGTSGELLLCLPTQVSHSRNVTHDQSTTGRTQDVAFGHIIRATKRVHADRQVSRSELGGVL